MAWIPLATAATSAGIGALGADKAAAAAKAAQKIKDAAAQKIYDIDAPDVEDLQYDPTTASYVGDVDPTLQANLGNITSAAADITSDPRFQTAQYQSLGALDDIVNSGGLTASDKLLNQTAQNDASMQASREQAKILQDAQERGMGGSGTELAARLASSQGAANRGATAAATQQATAQQRALDAIKERGALGTSMQSADYAQQNSAAAAQDLIAKFNQTNAYNVNYANQTASNTAATGNQGVRQTVANNAATVANTAAQANAAANTTAFNNKLSQATAGAAAATGSADARTAAGQATANQYGAIAAAVPGVVKAGTDAYNSYSSDAEEQKKNAAAGSAWGNA